MASWGRLREDSSTKGLSGEHRLKTQSVDSLGQVDATTMIPGTIKRRALPAFLRLGRHLGMPSSPGCAGFRSRQPVQCSRVLCVALHSLFFGIFSGIYGAMNVGSNAHTLVAPLRLFLPSLNPGRWTTVAPERATSSTKPWATRSGGGHGDAFVSFLSRRFNQLPGRHARWRSGERITAACEMAVFVRVTNHGKQGVNQRNAMGIIQVARFPCIRYMHAETEILRLLACFSLLCSLGVDLWCVCVWAHRRTRKHTVMDICRIFIFVGAHRIKPEIHSVC